MTTTPKIVYLAGPDVFLPDAIAQGQRKTALCARYGLTGLFPLDNQVDLTAPDAARQIFLGNTRMMDEADTIVANLTPFRGPSADAGTVYELGYMIGRGKRALAYCNDVAIYAHRVARDGPLHTSENGIISDREGLVVEDFKAVDNLMITQSLSLYGASLVMPRSQPADKWRDLTAFEQCLQMLAGHSPR